MPSVISRRRSGGRLLVIVAIGLLVVASAQSAGAASPKAGFTTSRPSMLTPSLTGMTVKPLITTGEVVDGKRFEALPDGISLVANGNGSVDAYLNHETSRVPFPLQANGSAWFPTTNANGNQNDFLNSQLAKVKLQKQSAGVLSVSFAIDSPAGFQRFCSNFQGTSVHGFSRPMIFTNEEGVDWVKESDPTFPAFPGDADGRQIGVVVAYDVKAAAYQPIWGMGRFNHENSVATPGYGYPVLVSGDDTFTTNAARSQSQLYMYTADSADDVWNDNGSLWAFVSDDPDYQKYEDFAPNDTTSISGHFIEVPKEIATGKNPDGSEMMAADVPEELGGPADPPPNTSTQWQQFNNAGIDGPQWVLEWWSRENGVFGFIRVEDTTYDKRAGMSKHLYIVDSGRGTAGASADGTSTNGRIWEMVLNEDYPTQVDSLRVLIEGDDSPVKTPGEIHQPDNIESTANALYITEDPGSSQQFPFGSIDPLSGNYDPNATNGRVWQYKFTGPTLQVAAVIDQSLDELSGYDVDPVPAGNHGFWEASGVIDASAAFGPGTFLITVQAHSLWVDSQNSGDDLTRLGGVWSYGGDDFTDWINKREGGQLLLMTIPGG